MKNTFSEIITIMSERYYSKKRAMYSEYKRLCEPLFKERCKHRSIQHMTSAELLEYSKELMHLHSQFKMCAESRRKYQQTYFAQRGDPGHETAIRRAETDAALCSDLIAAVRKRMLEISRDLENINIVLAAEQSSEGPRSWSDIARSATTKPKQYWGEKIL